MKNNLVWEAKQSPSSARSMGVWFRGQRCQAVGDSGAIIHYDGTAWTAGRSGLQAGWNGVWATGDSNIWAVGGSGTIALGWRRFLESRQRRDRCAVRRRRIVSEQCMGSR